MAEAAWSRTKALAALVVVLAVAVHSAEVQTLDEVSARATGGVAARTEAARGGVVDGASAEEAGPVRTVNPKKKKFKFDRKAFFHGDIDSDEASLDNGDDTNLLEIWESAKAARTAKAAADASDAHDRLGESVDITQEPSDEPVNPANTETADATDTSGTPAATSNSSGLPALPHISPLDEKYMPAIMDKLIKMRDEMANLKGANWEEILEHHRDGVVQIMVVKKKFMWKAVYRAPLSEEISGSGWFINNAEFSAHSNATADDDLLVVTNAHVAKNAAEINILVPSLGQEPIPAEVVGLCSQRDIAILRVVDKAHLLALYKAKTGKVDIVRMSLGDSDLMKRGARVMAVGYPLGLKSVKASMGIVSGYQQFKSALYLQITAPINPGNSGGPLFNDKGEVVGINSAKIASASGMSFSISSVQLKVMLDVLYQRRQFVVPYLGYGFSVGTKLIQNYLEVSGDEDKMGGIYITKVHPNGLFQEAGVEAEDLLLTVDGANIDRFGQTWMPTMKDNINILGLLARKQVGSKLTLGVWRKSKKQLLSLQAKYDETPPFAIPFIYEPILHKPKYQIFAGIVFMELVENMLDVLMDDNMAELIKYMKPENRMQTAVIIAGLLPGSVADLDGSVKKGLIVQKFNGVDITTMDDICTALSSASGKWYTVSTSKTFTALKASKVDDAEEDPEMSKSDDYCSQHAAATDSSSNATDSTSGDGDGAGASAELDEFY